MATGYKIRLGDGSEIGPMDLAAVQDWYRQGLVGLDSLVLTPRGSRWVPLKHAIPGLQPVAASDDLRAAVMEATRAPGRATISRTARPAETLETARETQRWRTMIGGALLLLIAGGCTFWLLYPHRWIAALDVVPWREVVLGVAALGLLLIRGWELARKLVRLALVLVACGLFAACGILIVQRVPWPAFAVLGSTLVLLAGLIMWLAGGRLSALRITLSALVVVAGAAGIVRLGLIPERPELQRIQTWAREARAVTEPERGMRLDLPDRWVALKEEQDLVPVEDGAVLALAQPRRGGMAVVSAATPRRVLSAEEYLDHALRERALPTRMEEARGEVMLGELVGKRVESRWESEGTRYRDVMVVARDGPTYWSLAAWIPDDGSALPAAELDALVAGFALQGKMGAQVREAVSATFTTLPFLTATAAEAVIASTGEAAPEPHVLFRHTMELLARGRFTLSAPQIEELEKIDAAIDKALPRSDRRRFRLYLSRIGQQLGTTPDDDRAAAELLGRAALKLPAPDRTRLEQLYEEAIVAAAG